MEADDQSNKIRSEKKPTGFRNKEIVGDLCKCSFRGVLEAEVKLQ